MFEDRRPFVSTSNTKMTAMTHAKELDAEGTREGIQQAGVAREPAGRQKIHERAVLEVVEVPDQLRTTLEQAGVTTMDDLLSLDLVAVEALQGVGSTRIRLIRELQQQACESVFCEAEVDDDGYGHSAATSSPYGAALRAATVVALVPPTSAGGALRKLEVHTLGELLDMPLARLRSTGEVRRFEIGGLGVLLFRAHRILRLAASTDLEDPFAAMLMGLRRHDIDLREKWEDVLVSLPLQVTRALRRAKFVTLADIVVGLMNGSLSELRQFERKHVEQLREHITRLASLGRDDYRFGDGGRPQTLAELIPRAFDLFDDREKQIVRRRCFGGETLDMIAVDHHRSRSQILRIERKAMSRASEMYAEPAKELLDPLLQALAATSGVCDVDSALQLVSLGASELYDAIQVLNFAAVLIGVDLRPFGSSCLTNLSSGDLADLKQRILAALTELHVATLSLGEAHDAVAATGIELTPPVLADFLRSALNIVVRDDGLVVLPWANLGAFCEEILEELGHPARIQPILEAYLALRVRLPEAKLPELDVSSLRERLADARAIWSCGRGVYIHEDCFSFDKSRLGPAIDWAIDRLAGVTEQVSARKLLREMERAGVAPPGMTPHLLKDGIHRHPKGLTFTNSLLVAHVDSYLPSGESLTDRVLAVLRSSDGGMSSEQVIRELERYGYAVRSLKQVLSRSTETIRTRPRHYLHRDCLGVDREAQERILDLMFQHLPDDGTPISRAVDVALSSGEREALAAHGDPGFLLSALAQTDPRFATCAGGLIASADKSHCYSLLSDTILGTLDELGVAFPREVRAKLIDRYGYQGYDEAVNDSLIRELSRDRVGRLAGSLYYRRCESEETEWAHWAKRRALVLDAARTKDLNGDDPHAIVSLVRFIHRGSDEDDLATDVIERTLQREDLPVAIAANLRDLRVALDVGRP